MLSHCESNGKSSASQGGSIIATLKDVAAKAGVSIATVSYCINGTHSLSPETRTRIMHAIKELNYIPNAQARNLKRQTSRELCAIFPDLEDQCNSEFLKGILLQASSSGYSVTVYCSYNDIEKEKELIENAISKNCAGILLVTCQPQNTSYFQTVINDHSSEVVFLDRLPHKIDAVFFGFDNYAAISYLTARLISEGYQDIALLSGPEIYFSESEAIAGYCDALDTAGIPLQEERMQAAEVTKEGAFSTFLRNWVDNPPQAVITTSQIMCLGVIEACNIAHLRIPDDICLLSLGVDSWNRSSFNPDIILSARPAFSLGTHSCEALIDIVEHAEKPESRFHLLQDSVSGIPLHIPALPHRDEKQLPQPSQTLHIAAADLPSIHAIESISADFFQQHHYHLHFHYFSLKELFDLIPRDARKEYPDFDIYLFDTSWFQFLYHNGCLLDITDDFYRTPESKRYFFPRNLSNCCVNDRYYGFPVIGGTQFLLYRKDLFTDPDLRRQYKKDHNLSLRAPKTWKEFNSIARFFTRKINPNSPTEYGTAITSVLNEELALEFEPRMWGHGGSFYDYHGHLNINTPQNCSALKNLMEAFQYSRSGITSNQEVFNEFVNGNAAMITTFTEYAAQIQNNMHSVYLQRSGFGIIPSQIPTNVGWHFGLPVNTWHKSASLQFFDWLRHRHLSYYMAILGGSSSLVFPYNNHELQKMYPWMSLTKVSMEASRSRVYPLQKNNGQLMAPNEFESILCDQIRTFPDSSQKISSCLDRIQTQVIQALNR